MCNTFHYMDAHNEIQLSVKHTILCQHSDNTHSTICHFEIDECVSISNSVEYGRCVMIFPFHHRCKCACAQVSVCNLSNILLNETPFNIIFSA